MHSKRYLSAIFLLLLSVAFAGASDREDRAFGDPIHDANSLQRYGVNGNVKGLFDEPMPKGWFSKPEAAQAANDSYTAFLPLIDDVTDAGLMLVNEDPEADADVVIEVRDRNGDFAAKFLVRVPLGEERSLDLDSLAKFDGAQISLFSTTPIAAFSTFADMDQVSQIALNEPAERDDQENMQQSKGANCLVTSYVPIKITHNSPGGGTVNAWASMFIQVTGLTIQKNYMTVYYPTSSSVFHYPMKKDWGAQCDFPISGLSTAKGPNHTFPDHSWGNVKNVLQYYGVQGTVTCQDIFQCSSSETWTYQRR